MTLQPPVPQGFPAALGIAPGTDPELVAVLQPIIYNLTVQFQAIANAIASGMTDAATTANRPTALQMLTLPNKGVGFMMFDQTLGIPIWASANSGTVVTWVNSAGTPV